MRRNRMRHRDADASRALDLLVLDVVKTLVRPSLEAPAEAPVPQVGRAAQAVASETPPTPAGPRPSSPASKRDAIRESASPPRSSPMPPKHARATTATRLAAEDRAPVEEERLLDQEEEEFITRTVDWLSRRSNPDELLAIIWTLVTDADPDAFYRPESPTPPTPAAESPTAEPGPADAAPEIASRADE
jgi:hypothetical protein